MRVIQRTSVRKSIQEDGKNKSTLSLKDDFLKAKIEYEEEKEETVQDMWDFDSVDLLTQQNVPLSTSQQDLFQKANSKTSFFQAEIKESMLRQNGDLTDVAKMSPILRRQKVPQRISVTGDEIHLTNDEASKYTLFDQSQKSMNVKEKRDIDGVLVIKYDDRKCFIPFLNVKMTKKWLLEI